MKIRNSLIALLLVFATLAGQVSNVSALPPLPSSFWGMATFDGENAPLGATVSAWINGVRYASGFTQLYQESVIYALDVPGDDPSTPAVEGGVPGSLIVFNIDDFTIPQTSLWQSGTNVQLDLTVVSLSYTYFPFLHKGMLGK